MTRRKIYFARDQAGFNNVRLQFETLVVLAALTDRVLVLPPKSPIAHISEPLYELDVWSASALADVISFEPGVVNQEQHPLPPDVHRVEEHVWRTPKFLEVWPQDRDWYFAMGESRLMNFECLDLTDEQRRLAAQVVFSGVRYKRQWVEAAYGGLTELGLVPGGFVGAHLRRGDFEVFAPGAFQSGARIAEVLNDIGGDLPLLVATNAQGGDALFDELVAASSARRVIDLERTYVYEGEVSRIAITSLMLAAAHVFAGTPRSTFTLGVFKLRTMAFWEYGDVDLRQLYAIATPEPPKRDASSVCWNVAQTFRHLPKVDTRAFEPVLLHSSPINLKFLMMSIHSSSHAHENGPMENLLTESLETFGNFDQGSGPWWVIFQADRAETVVAVHIHPYVERQSPARFKILAAADAAGPWQELARLRQSKPWGSRARFPVPHTAARYWQLRVDSSQDESAPTLRYVLFEQDTGQWLPRTMEPVLYSKTASACPPGHELIALEDCLRAARAFDTSIEDIWQGSESTLPSGCSVREGKSPNVHFNEASVGASSRGRSFLCRRDAPRPTTALVSQELQSQATGHAALAAEGVSGRRPTRGAPEAALQVPTATKPDTGSPPPLGSAIKHASVQVFLGGFVVGASVALLLALASLFLAKHFNVGSAGTVTPHSSVLESTIGKASRYHSSPME